MATTMTSAEFQRGIGEAQEKAEKEPVIITRHGRPRLVLCSHERYHQLVMAVKRAAGELVNVSPETSQAVAEGNRKND